VTALDYDVTDPSQTLVEESEKYVSIPEWVLLHPQLSAPAVRLYGVLKMYARRSERAWPGRATLAEHLGCSEDSIDRHMKQLKDAGAVDVIPRWWDTDPSTGERRVHLEPGHLRAQTSNIYRLRWTPPGRTAAAPPSRKDAALPAAELRPKAHALETHTDEAQEKLARARTEDPALTLADELLTAQRGKIAVTRVALAGLLAPPLANGVTPETLRRAVARMVREGERLAPWTLQEYVAKTTSVSNLPFMQ
jgi:hypothetical protein